jgi:hypothetical protein
MEPYFYKLNALDNLAFIKDEITKKSDQWVRRFNFDVLQISPYKFVNHSLFELIIKFKGKPVILKTDPMYWYNWHTDSIRKFSINSFIDGPDSRCFFGETEDTDSVLVKLTELVYEPGRYYLFNTQASHAVLNGNNTRYILSIGFIDPYTYQDALAYCQENNL